MSKNSLEFYNIGTKVKLADDVYGNIITVSIGPNNSISYKCGWWSGRTYCTETFNSSEIEAVVTTEKTRIGTFRSY
jgi:uncharacterized protein YodC (DUF2158 family)